MNLSILVNIKKIVGFIWPYLEKLTNKELESIKEELLSDKETIDRASWENWTEIALEEARRLNDAESERKKSAETKAGIYLAVVTTLAPVLTSLIANLWSDKLSFCINVLLLVVFLLATSYLLNSGVWAFKALRVSKFYRVDVAELSGIWSNENPQIFLIKEILIAVRSNRNEVNDKISYIKMTHEFLLRAFICFIIMLLIQTTAARFDFHSNIIKSSDTKEYQYNKYELKKVI